MNLQAHFSSYTGINEILKKSLPWHSLTEQGSPIPCACRHFNLLPFDLRASPGPATQPQDRKKKPWINKLEEQKVISVMLIYYPVGGGTRVKWVLSLRQGHLHYLHMKHVATKERPATNKEAAKSWSSNIETTYFAEFFEIYSSSKWLFCS